MQRSPYCPLVALFSILSVSFFHAQAAQTSAAPSQQPPTAPTQQVPTDKPAAVPGADPAAVDPATVDASKVDAAKKDAAEEPEASGSAASATGAKKKNVKKKKEKAPKLVPVTVEHGVLTVDGWAGKADLNYQIADFHFFYIWSPGLGTVVISNQEFKGAKFQASAFDGGTLTVQADGHTVQLASEHKLMNTKKPEGAYVLVDPDSPAPGKYPQVGYGLTSKAPYAWPGALADVASNTKAPPLPEALRPSLATVTKCDVDGAGKKTNCHEVTPAMYLGKNDKGELKQTDLARDPSKPATTKK